MMQVASSSSATTPLGGHAPKKMGLLPLEFADCLIDSPYFRENLKSHEKQLDQTSSDIKGIIRDIQDVVDAAKTLSKTKRTLASSLASFQFDCLGTSLTDDEIIIATSLKEFSRFLNEVEDEMDRFLDHAHEKFIQPLVDFRKKQIGIVKMTKKDFDKATQRFCTSQDAYIKSKKEESLAEAAEAVRHDQKVLRSASLEYVYLMHVVQERKKFEFVEALLSFMHSWSNYYRFGHERTESSSGYTNDLKSRVQRCRNSFDATRESYESLKMKMATDSRQDPGAFNPMYTRQGYLYVQLKNKSMPFNVVAGSQWIKHYCQYQAKSKTLTMIPYNQLQGKITTTETVKVTSCLCKTEDSAEKFRFVVHGEDLTQGASVTYTFQAMTEFERKHWVESLGGTWPAISTLQKLRADSVEDNLNSMAFTFLKDCLQELESRGLNDQGLYRVGGVVSKVKKLLNEGLIGCDKVDISDPKQWESKTIASAVKQYFRDLNKPLMTHTLYSQFVEAVKSDSEAQRLAELVTTMKKLPVANREMLKVLIRHLSRVAAKHETNLMTPANLGVVFGPTLLRPKEETVASIMDIKFCNEVIEILIEHCDTFFNPMHCSNNSDSSPETRKVKAKAPSIPEEPLHVHHNHGKHSREQRGSSTPKRTHSFSSFSQLSTNSLPDIKELHPTVLTIANNGHHYHPNHRSKLDVPDSGSSSSSSSASKTKVLQSKFPSSKPLIKAKSRDDDLMASLEMMESLAADLPQNGNGNSNLKRSYTVQHRRKEHQEERKKPPLPKISHPQLSSSQQQQHHFSSHNQNNNLKQVLNSRITSGSSPNLPLHSSPRLTRPKELFVRQITLPMESYEVEETPIVPSPSLATPQQKNVPPPIPARRYPRVYHQLGHSSNTDESENDLHRRGSESSPKNFRSNESSPNNFRSNDSGILTSPSPPTDSGIALSPPTQPRLTSLTKPPDEFADVNSSCKKSVSILHTHASKSSDTASLSSSESDTTSSGTSRYDNVVSQKQLSGSVSNVHLPNNRRFSNSDNNTTSSSSTTKTSTLVAAAAEIAARKLNSGADDPLTSREISTQTIEDGIDGDDEDEETSDSSSDILVLDSSSAGSDAGICKKYSCEEYEDDDEDDEIDEDLEELEQDGTKNHDEIEISDHFRRRGNSRRKFKRDSGPYDNFTLPGAVSSSSSRNSPASTAEGHLLENSSKTKGFQKLLAAGPTSNV